GCQQPPSSHIAALTQRQVLIKRQGTGRLERRDVVEDVCVLGRAVVVGYSATFTPVDVEPELTVVVDLEDGAECLPAPHAGPAVWAAFVLADVVGVEPLLDPIPVP